MRQPDREATMLSLLQFYKDQDADPRQALICAILFNRDYTPKDVPFLKNMLTAVADLHFDEQPQKERTWKGPSKTKMYLAQAIYALLGKGDYFEKTDVGILLKDLKAWLAKYVP